MMRAPQFGHSKRKRRGSIEGWAKPLSVKLPATPTLWRAVGLRGPNEPLGQRRIRYLEPRQVQYADGTYGAKVTLHLYHKSAKAMGGEGPIVSKQPTVVRKTHRR